VNCVIAIKHIRVLTCFLSYLKASIQASEGTKTCSPLKRFVEQQVLITKNSLWNERVLIMSNVIKYSRSAMEKCASYHQRRAAAQVGHFFGVLPFGFTSWKR
jgi:hypothetical protein